MDSGVFQPDLDPASMIDPASFDFDGDGIADEQEEKTTTGNSGFIMDSS